MATGTARNARLCSDPRPLHLRGHGHRGRGSGLRGGLADAIRSYTWGVFPVSQLNKPDALPPGF